MLSSSIALLDTNQHLSYGALMRFPPACMRSRSPQTEFLDLQARQPASSFTQRTRCSRDHGGFRHLFEQYDLPKDGSGP